MILAKIADGREWRIGPEHQALVDGERVRFGDIREIDLKNGELGLFEGNAEGAPMVGVAYTDPVTGIKVILELHDDVAGELGEQLARPRLRVARPSDLSRLPRLS